MPSKILGHDVAFCVLLPPSYDSDTAKRFPVLYFLHGIGENEQALINSGGLLLVQDLRDQKQIGEFLIVTPNAGRTFYINSRDGRVKYEDFFIREFIPYIEKAVYQTIFRFLFVPRSANERAFRKLRQSADGRIRRYAIRICSISG